MVWLGNSFLRLSCPRLFGKRYDFVILAYNPFGISGFTDDVIRTARALKIPSIGLQMNLDNIIARFPLERPNYLGVWGDTHFLWAKAFYQYPTNNIFSVGTPRVRHLWSLRPSPSEARKKLALNSDDFVILYAPSSRRHDEKYVLEALSKAIQQNLFGKKVVVLLKKQKGKETEFSGSLQAGEKEPFDLPSVVTWDEADKSGPTPLRRFPYIYAACDAIMSPFSTMVYEAALLGKPSLILNYDPRDYGETLGHSMDWKAIQLATWHFSIKNNEGAIFCRSRADLIPSIRKLIRQVDSPFARELTRHAACSNIYFGPKDPAEKLLEFLKIKYKCAIKKREE